MLLTGTGGASLELRIVGYEAGRVPLIGRAAWHLAHGRLKGDWLNVHIQAKNERGSWEATDPCLTANEARSLANWLERQSETPEEQATLDFLEPNLEFRVVGVRGDLVRLRVHLAAEYKPEWAESEDSVVLELRREDLRRAAADLRSELTPGG